MNVDANTAATASATCNIAARLAESADRWPDVRAVVMPLRRDTHGKRQYRSVTFRELDQDSDRIARGLREYGVRPGMRLALFVRPSIDFVSLVFALFKAGAVSILIDPGMGLRGVLRCLEEAKPEGFVSVPLVQAIRVVCRRRFPLAKLNVTVGRRWFWKGTTLDELRGGAWSGRELAATVADDPAAIIFTTGSTGPSKGVLYRHGNFDRQVTEIRDMYVIKPGEIDLAGFPLFGLFNAAMGVTTVIPDMNPSHPARVNPANIVEAVRDWNVTQSFGSPAIWNRVGTYCSEHKIKLPTLRRVLSAGAPVPPRVLEMMQEAIHPDGNVHTPYGATEALPVATISAREVLGETKAKWATGGGTCVGRKFPGIEWRVIAVVEGAIDLKAESGKRKAATMTEAVDHASKAPLSAFRSPLSTGEIGELIVRGPVVTREYVTRVESNALAKIVDGESVWHRMGDVGYLDASGRFWFCGRMAHRVLTASGPMYTIPCEAIFNQHGAVHRSALVGVGERGKQRPVIICEPWPGNMPENDDERRKLIDQLRALAQGNPLTQHIRDFLLHPSFPVDIRHNAKIFREQLAVWAAEQLR